MLSDGRASPRYSVVIQSPSSEKKEVKMQAGKNAMESMKESAANAAASAKAGMEKTKAAVQGKVEKMTAHDPVEKEMAAEKKHDRIRQAELSKQEAREHNAATRQAATAGGHGTHPTTTHGTATYSTTGTQGYTPGTQQMSAMPGHGTGQPMGQVTEGIVQSHTVGTHTGTGRPTAHNTRVEGGGTGYSTGGSYI